MSRQKDNQNRNVIMKNKTLFVLFFFLIGCLVFTARDTQAQTPQPTPTPELPTTIGGYQVTSSVEFGVRGLSVNGSDNKFRSDLNYKPGFRIFDSSFLVEDKKNQKNFFDTLLVTSSGWSADPSGVTRVNMEKLGSYRFDANVRRVTYFNNLTNHALNEHTQNTRHKFGDFDLTVFPQSDKFRMRFGYSFNRDSGPGSFTTRAYSDEFPITSDVQSRSNDFRIGVEGKLLGFNVSLSQGYRYFKDDTNYSILTLNQGNNPTNTARLATLKRDIPIKGNSHYTIFNAHRTFAKRVDFTGRFIYSSTNTNFQLLERITGRDNSNNIVDLDRFDISGDAKRPQARGDVGVTFLVTDKFRISETFTYDRFNISGGNQFAEALFRRNAAGNPLANTFTNTASYNMTGYRRAVNTIEADYQVNNRLAFNIGYRYTNRRVVLEGFERNLAVVNPVFSEDEFDNRTNTLIAGMKAKPTKNWVVYMDVEHGGADNVFTRLANYKFTNFRVRSRWTFNEFSINLSAISKDNNNPSRTIEIPPRNFGADVNSRVYSGTFDWSPTPKFSLSSGYTFQHLTSETAIIVPVNNVRLQGISQFFMRDHYAFFDIFAHPHNRISLYASYRINNDRGQGNKGSALPQNIITSYPFQFQSPEARFAFRLTKNIDWNVGYQYYNYKDKFAGNQNYRAHLPYTSLRIYFGGADR